MPKPQRIKIIALQLEDGSTSIMQTFADVIIEAEVRRSALPSPAVSWREITQEEAAQIRAARTKLAAPLIPHNLPPDMAAILGRVVDAVTEKLTAAEADIASMRAENDQLRREILAWAREQVREVQS
jgi:hypothetical protein